MIVIRWVRALSLNALPGPSACNNYLQTTPVRCEGERSKLVAPLSDMRMKPRASAHHLGN